MDIKVGEYIRTIGIIGKLIRIEKDKIDISLKWYVFLGKDEFGIEKELYVNKPYIEKHSKDIIDLIEVGDIVNKKEIIEVRKQNGKTYLMTSYCPIDFIKSEIKEILTKEQYNQNCYKIPERNSDIN